VGLRLVPGTGHALRADRAITRQATSTPEVSPRCMAQPAPMCRRARVDTRSGHLCAGPIPPPIKAILAGWSDDGTRQPSQSPEPPAEEVDQLWWCGNGSGYRMLASRPGRQAFLSHPPRRAEVPARARRGVEPESLSRLIIKGSARGITFPLSLVHSWRPRCRHWRTRTGSMLCGPAGDGRRCHREDDQFALAEFQEPRPRSWRPQETK